MLYLVLCLLITPSSSAEDEPLSTLKKLEASVNAFDAKGMMSLVANNAYMVSKNGEVLHSRAAVDHYISKMSQSGESILLKLESKGVLEKLVWKSQQSLVGIARSEDHYVFRNGMEFRISTPMAFWMIREGGNFRFRGIHFCFNSEENPLVEPWKKWIWLAFPLGFLLSLFLSWGFSRIRRIL